MARANVVIGVLVLALSCVLAPGVAYAQQSQSGIAGAVKDTSGGVLPGVTVEAASPALIEKIRTVSTDSQGQYKIVDLRPGSYTVTFTLPGFTTLRRDGIELKAGFTATVNADMQVGSLEETITVTGAAPLVDTQNTRQQKVVSSSLLASLPTSSGSVINLVALMPGMTGAADVGGSVGVYASGGFFANNATFHGKTGLGKQTYDGMRTHNMGITGAIGYIPNVATVEETTLETGGVSAESIASGAAINMIPKEGGNTFRYSLSGLFANDTLQSDNLTDALRSRGLTTTARVIKVFDATGTLGGPIRKDKLWFFTAQRVWGNRNQVPGIFWNKTQGTPFYTPDPDRPWIRFETIHAHALRLTWQASAKNKVGLFTDLQDNIDRGAAAFIAPEAVGTTWRFWPQGLFQGTWSSPRTSRLLLEAGGAATISHFPGLVPPGVGPNDISIVEQSTGLQYNSQASIGSGGNWGDTHNSDRFSQRFSVSYITGSHAFKVGMQLEEGMKTFNTAINGDVQYQFLNGVPAAVVEFATPYLEKERMKADLGLYAQDQWTVKHFTLNYGLRFDYFNGYVPAQHNDAGPFVPARDFAAVHKVPEWKELSPRLGLAYDVFGNGKTAFKVSLGRYVGPSATEIATATNPMQTSVNSVSRPWNDTNKNYVPDCDLRNAAANGECGAVANQNFGKNNPNATRYADDVLHGLGARDYNWDVATEVQHQVLPGMSVTGGYYRNWYGNFRVTDNLAVTSADYNTYCITAPTNPQLPSGGGYQVCGLYDINPSKFGQFSNLVTQASNFGKQKQVSNFFNIVVDGRFRSGIQVGGGIDAGRTVTDQCFVVDSPQQLLYCHVVTPMSATLQVKINGSYPLPSNFMLSGVFQNVAGPNIVATYPAPTAIIAPSLGRNVAGGARSANVPLIEPQTQFEDRRTQLDLRLSRMFSIGKSRLRANLDLYNVLNANSILAINTTYGSLWRRPTSVLDGRLIEFSGQLTF